MVNVRMTMITSDNSYDAWMFADSTLRVIDSLKVAGSARRLPNQHVVWPALGYVSRTFSAFKEGNAQGDEIKDWALFTEQET